MGTVLLLLAIVAAIPVVSLAAGLLVGGMIRVANRAAAIRANDVHSDDAFVEYLRLHGHPPALLDDDELARMLAAWSRECSP